MDGLKKISVLNWVIIGVTASVLISTVVLFVLKKKVEKIEQEKPKSPVIEEMTDAEIEAEQAANEAAFEAEMDKNWHPNKIAYEIKQNLEGYNMLYHPSTALKVLRLNENRLKRLYAYYNKYYAKDYKTLTKLFANEWQDPAGYYAAVVKYLKKYKLY